MYKRKWIEVEGTDEKGDKKSRKRKRNKCMNSKNGMEEKELLRGENLLPGKEGKKEEEMQQTASFPLP